MSSERNRLTGQKSPYLLQHAENPVDWYPWDKDAFIRAEEEDKPIFLSIGYSTCHWCHVMAHESFEDNVVARLMNDTFISIKVDREERPDIDIQYMKVCQMITGSGGWPLTIIMTPDKRPFFAATYLPKETIFGQIGLLELIPRFKHLWTNRKQELLASAQQITRALQQTGSVAGRHGLEESELHLCFEHLSKAFDEEWGGFSIAPKFPSPHTLLFLLRYWKHYKKPEALAMVKKTLQAMQHGGIQDHVGYGFHRYSTDRQWLVPHFEKMLYDQALLATAFIEAYQATGQENYSLTARNVFTYILRDMTSPQGGFYTAEDADSEGQEGKFYLWTMKEIEHILSHEDSSLFVKAFNIEDRGNFNDEVTGEKGTNIPHLIKSLEQMASDSGIPSLEIRKRLDSARQKVFEHRDKRVHPRKDDKILTDWNGLMIAALSQGARVFDEPAYSNAAKQAVDFVLSNMLDPNGRPFHRYRDGEAAIPGNIDDYAFLIYGLLELYQTIFETKYLKQALTLNQHLIDHFWDNEQGGFYFTADDGEQLLTRQKEIYDGAVPSGNSIAMLNLLHLSRITGDATLEEKAAHIGYAFNSEVRRSPSAYTQLMIALNFAVSPSYEIVITGQSSTPDTLKMLSALNTVYTPNRVILFVPTNSESAITDIAPFTRGMATMNRKATAYVCSNHTCGLPTTDAAIMLQMLEDK
jgi:uncharacterized protein